MRRVVFLFVMTGLATAGCEVSTGLDLDPDAYDRIPLLQDLDWTEVEPAAEWDYWEVRAAGIPTPPIVLGSGGRLSRAELGADVREELDETLPPSGFSAGCLPAYCYRYIVTVEDGAIGTIRSAAGVRDFLGAIRTREEAILLLSARDYLWWDGEEDENTGVRAVSDGWDLVVLELVRTCTPVQTDRVRFRVHDDGDITERAREVWERHENACV